MRKLFKSLVTTTKVVGITFIIWLILDQTLRLTGIGTVMPDHYDKQNFQRKAAPYIEFKGAPNALDHDQFGYRWVPKALNEGVLKISFFGGSTGYHGEPPIASLLEANLRARNIATSVANFSVVSSNHRQHLHNIIESRQIYAPDVIVFYGGYNETLQSAFYDPRPGFPYNFFYRHETSLLGQFLIKYSPTFFLIDKVFTKNSLGGITPLVSLREHENPLSEDWNKRVTDTYFETIELAKTVANSFPSQKCGKTLFVFFYQPYQVIDEFSGTHANIRKRVASYAYGYDVSDALSNSGQDVFTDIVHVTQTGNQIMANEIAALLVSNAAFMQCTGQIK